MKEIDIKFKSPESADRINIDDCEQLDCHDCIFFKKILDRRDNTSWVDCFDREKLCYSLKKLEEFCSDTVYYLTD